MKNDKRHPRCTGLSRRTFLADTGMGFTGLALGALLFKDGVVRADTAAYQKPNGLAHFKPRAKSVIWIFMLGGVSHVESFDVKPMLTKYGGKTIDETPFGEVLDEKRVGKIITEKEKVTKAVHKRIMPLQVGYKPYGQNGLLV